MTGSRRDRPEIPARFKERVQEWARRLRVSPKQVRVQRMTRKWASCSTAGRVTFSTALLAQSKGFQTYVVVHELLHLRVPNHGRLFNTYMSAFVPGWKRHASSAGRRTARRGG